MSSALYLIHGWLHLAGYDDRRDDDRAAMRRAEQEALDIPDQNAAAAGFKLSPRQAVPLACVVASTEGGVGIAKAVGAVTDGLQAPLNGRRLRVR